MNTPPAVPSLRRALPLVLGLLSALASSVSASDKVNGTVSNDQNQAPAGLSVSVLAPGGQSFLATIESGGKFETSNVSSPDGRIKVMVAAEGYNTVIIDHLTTHGPDPINLNVRLKRVGTPISPFSPPALDRLRQLLDRALQRAASTGQ